MSILDIHPAGATMLRKAVLALSLVLSICSVTFPLAAEAQQVGKVYRIGVLGASTAAQTAEQLELFQQGLIELGWVNERAITFEERYADGHYERLPRFAAELVALKVDLIFAHGGTPAVQAAMKATRAIPMSFLRSRIRLLRIWFRVWRIRVATSPVLR